MDVLGLSASNPAYSYKASYAPPYASSVSSSASSSSSSVFSLDGHSTQSSISSTATNPVDVAWENEGEQSLPARASLPSLRGPVPPKLDAAVPPELRKHPRRTSTYVAQSNGAPCARPPPCLMRQSERKVNFVDNLVGTASQIVEIIWPLSAVSLRSDSSTGCKGVLPLRTFIQETLRRSRTSYSTLQVALYYLIKIKPHVPSQTEQSRDKPVCRAMQCGRRMFLAALILASKYLQDRNYSARAWSKISGLNTLEINQNELMFLEAVGWRLHISEATFQRWTDVVLKYTSGAGLGDGHCWRTVIPRLTPELDTVEFEPITPPSSGESSVASSPSPRSVPAAYEPAATTSLPSIHEQIPSLRRNVPMPLEPMPRMEYPPSISRPQTLPTPQMTPQSSLASTPAASVTSCGPRRPSIGAAVSQAQNMGMARSTLDQRPPLAFCKANSFDGYPAVVRRSSLARSTSSASSPESMVSDVSTLSSVRSSRSSSVSSNASGPAGPSSQQTRLAVKATLNHSMRESRKQMVTVVSPIDESGGIYSSPEGYATSVGQVPDFSHFSLGTPVDQEAARSLCELSGAVPRPQPSTAGRKRGRTGSEDQLLQNQVRHLINLDNGDGGWPEGTSARSFVIPESNQQLSSLQMSALSGPAGMKRACCGSEARKIALNPSVRTYYLD
jgi:hypothetical protein